MSIVPMTSTGSETEVPSVDARDVYAGLDGGAPLVPPVIHVLAGTTPVATEHGVDWYKDDVATRDDITGPLVEREWHFGMHSGNIWSDGSDPGRQVSRFDVFLQLFPPLQLRLIVTLTNERLEATHERATTVSEMLKYFGIMILATRCQFSNRCDLWNTVPSHPYNVVYNFGRTGMTRHRFDTLHANIRYSRQLENRPVGMSSECYRWTLVDDFVTNSTQ
jgi:Transposase IS4